jgi:hypothetical protein
VEVAGASPSLPPSPTYSFTLAVSAWAAPGPGPSDPVPRCRIRSPPGGWHRWWVAKVEAAALSRGKGLGLAAGSGALGLGAAPSGGVLVLDCGWHLLTVSAAGASAGDDVWRLRVGIRVTQKIRVG